MDQKRNYNLLLAGLLILLLMLLGYGAISVIPQFDGATLSDAIQITLGNEVCCDPEPNPDDQIALPSPFTVFFYTFVIFINVLALMYVAFKIGRMREREHFVSRGLVDAS